MMNSPNTTAFITVLALFTVPLASCGPTEMGPCPDHVDVHDVEMRTSNTPTEFERSDDYDEQGAFHPNSQQDMYLYMDSDEEVKLIYETEDGIVVEYYEVDEKRIDEQ